MQRLAVRFSDYMQDWLYGSEGYYSRFRDIGKAGDFYTAVSTSAFFGAAIAEFFLKRLKAGHFSEHVVLCEIGAHRGYLLADMLRWIYSSNPALLETMRFMIVEPHEALQQEQLRYFESQFGDAVKLEHVTCLETLKEKEIFFVANEIFDAFACDLFYEGKIAYVQENAVVWQEADEASIAFAARYGLQKGEIARDYESFAEQMAKSAEYWEFVTFDYGEAYVRNDFSIRIYKAHRTYPLFDDEVDLARFFAQSDLTYDVNFAHLIDAYQAAGAQKLGYETQARALVRFGIIDILERYAKVAKDYAAYLREADKVKTLLAPTIMGDKFKMLHLAKRGA